jgi:FtsH-binding integral membrane protein
MVDHFNSAYGASTDAQAKEFDAGLRAYMLKVYNYMASGVLLTGIIAMFVSQTPAILQLFYTFQTVGDQIYLTGRTGLGWVVMISPLAFVLVMSFGINKLSSGALQMLFWAFASVFGLSLSTIFFQYTDVSIARTFFISAASFGALSLFGYTTKKNLSGMGTFLFMGLFGIILASIINIFVGSSMMHFIISALGVLIFAGFTAYDTQMIKNQYFMMSTGEMVKKGAIMGALNLYLDFVNLFMFLLSFLGDRE